ncbi:MAG: TFIIB-type zinc ribbon-containing protein [Candidatus Woesearchaeota archaeon]
MGNEDDHLQSINECPDCASENIVHSTMRDQVICKDCGLVFEPFTPVEKPAAAGARAAPAKKKAKPAKKARVKKARKAPKARKAKAKPARKIKKKPAKKKWGWW